LPSDVYDFVHSKLSPCGAAHLTDSESYEQFKMISRFRMLAVLTGQSSGKIIAAPIQRSYES